MLASIPGDALRKLMGIKSNKTFEEIVERLVTVVGITPSNARAPDREPDPADASPPDPSAPGVSRTDIVTSVPPIQADLDRDQE